MATCPKCNKEFDDGTEVCDVCGAQICDRPSSSDCVDQTNFEGPSYQSCGDSTTKNIMDEESVVVPEGKKKPLKKTIIYCGISAAVIIIIFVMILLIVGIGGSAKNNYGLYLKEGEVFFTDLKKDSKPWMLTDSIINGELNYSQEMWGIMFYLSEDGKYMFFPGDVSNNRMELFYKEVSNIDSDATKIDSNVMYYVVNTSTTVITYLKGEEGSLYQYKIKENLREKIANNVEWFEVSDDGTEIFYFEEGSLYKYMESNSERIANDISSVEYITEDFTTVYYIKDSSLYKQSKNEERVKIVSDIYDVLKIYDSGEIYYLTKQTESVAIKDYVTDDMKEVDASISEPLPPEYPDIPVMPWRYDYNTEADYNAAYEAYQKKYEAYEAEYSRLQTEYEEANTVYQEKLSRDELRNSIESLSFDKTSYTLRFFNGTEDIIMADSYVDKSCTVGPDAAIIIYAAYAQDTLSNIKISEIENIYDIKSYIENAFTSSGSMYIAVKNELSVIEDGENVYSCNINASGTVIYYISNIEEDNCGDLYRVSVSGNVVGTPELYDSNVYADFCSFIDDNSFKYFKDYEDGEGDLYINKELIDYDVKGDMVKEYNGIDKVFYFINWDDKKELGTLKVYNGKKSANIQDEAHTYFVSPGGTLLYLSDYSLDYNKGELYKWADGAAEKLDDDVSYIIPINSKPLTLYELYFDMVY